MRFFVSGHTGFKGAWLSALLKHMGHQVYGYALEPIQGGLFLEVDLASRIDSDLRGDLRDKNSLASAIQLARPDVVIHLGAQALVRPSYLNPSETFEINSQGTLNIVEAVQKVAPGAFLLAITTDKVYQNVGKEAGYVETDPLGFSDPYSTSKAMADLALQSWQKSFPDQPKLAIARAGNVIGPLDASVDRIIPDIFRAVASKQTLEIRNPEATRPWQHVLDCLMGYLKLIENQEKTQSQIAWNFGPSPKDEKSVKALVEESSKYVDFSWSISASKNSFHEQQKLTLDSSRARNLLGWSDVYSFEEAVRETFEFSKELAELPISKKWSTLDLYLEAFLKKAGLPKLVI